MYLSILWLALVSSAHCHLIPPFFRAGQSGGISLPGKLERCDSHEASEFFAHTHGDPSMSENDVYSKTCPEIWGTIALELKQIYSGCNQLASNALRFAFHDAAAFSSKVAFYPPAAGGVDGSLLLSNDEISRSSEKPMGPFRNFLLSRFNKYRAWGVSAADLVQFSASVAIRSCLGGPVVRTVVGREDSATAAPDGTLPAAFGPDSDADTLLQLWADKGINPRELAALMGAHSVSRAFAQQSVGIPVGAPQDSTPTALDTNYFVQTQAEMAPPGVYRFDSDVNLAHRNASSGRFFSEFARDSDNWSVAFAAAMYRLSVMGIPEEKVADLIDCTFWIK